MPTTKQNLAALYQQEVTRGNLQSDLAQLDAIFILEQYSDKHSSYTKFKQGVYLWGDVGRGKTLLMDMFCRTINPDICLRLHFYRFMQMIHEQLLQLEGQSDPLKHIAIKLKKAYSTICLDEFFIADIADAMLLGRLTASLFKQGINLICTSNITPDKLYENGLHRDRFLPCIKQIKQHLQIVQLTGKEDYRLRPTPRQSAYFIRNESGLENVFKHLTKGKTVKYNQSILLGNRPISIKAGTAEVLWLDFTELCETPRSSLDYIELAQKYNHVLLSQVPCFTASGQRELIKARGTEDSSSELFNTTGNRQLIESNSDNAARRFISLVDELYDCRINFYLSSETELDQLYKANLLRQPFQRTLSRLQEMSTKHYQSTPPRNRKF